MICDTVAMWILHNLKVEYTIILYNMIHINGKESETGENVGLV